MTTPSDAMPHRDRILYNLGYAAGRADATVGMDPKYFEIWARSYHRIAQIVKDMYDYEPRRDA